jgi:hypothetical protein
MEDGLKVDVNEETGEINLEWDPEDPRWSFLNGLTEEELSDMMMDAIKRRLEQEDDENLQ